MKLRSRGRLIYSAVLILALLLAIIAFKQQLTQITLPEKVFPQFIIIAIGLQFVFWFLSSFSWISVVEQFGSFEMNIVRGFVQCNVVAVGKYLPGKIWGVVNRGIDLKHQGLTYRDLILVNYFDQILLLHAGVIVGSIAYASNMGCWLFVLAVVGSIFSIVIVPMCHAFISFAIKKFFNIDCNDSLIEKVSVLRYAVLITFYTSVWLVAGLVFASIYYWLYGSNNNLFSVLISANAIGIIIGFLAVFAPGGIGIREAASLAILIHHISYEQAFVLVVVYRCWTIFTDILGGLMALALTRLSKDTSSSQ